MPDLDDDVDLVRSYLQGDEGAFSDIYRCYGPLVFAVTLRSLGDRDQAEEVVASTFAQVLLGLVLSDVLGHELADALGIDPGAADTRKSRLYDRLRLAVEVYWVTRPGGNEFPQS